MLFAFKMDRRLQDFLQRPLSFPQNTLGGLLYLQQWESCLMSQIRSGDSLQLMPLVWGRLLHPRIWDRRRISHQPVMFAWRPDELQHANVMDLQTSLDVSGNIWPSILPNTSVVFLFTVGNKSLEKLDTNQYKWTALHIICNCANTGSNHKPSRVTSAHILP